jgi:hypothetical protein
MTGRPAAPVEAVAWRSRPPRLIAGGGLCAAPAQETETMNDNGYDFLVIHSYPLEIAIEDGMMVKKFENRWEQLSGGKPIVATTHLDDEVSDAGLMEIWNAYVVWRRDVMATLPVEDQMFETTMNDREVWILEDRTAFTMLFPEDY